jgi:hypothetical protein
LKDEIMRSTPLQSIAYHQGGSRVGRHCGIDATTRLDHAVVSSNL